MMLYTPQDRIVTLGAGMQVHARAMDSAFNPLTISPLIWVAYRDLSTLYQDSGGTTPVTTDGDPIGYSGDKSANSNHATQGTTGTKATYKIAIKNGLSVARFDGGDKYALTSSPSISDFTLFFVVSRTSSDAGHAILLDNSNYGIRLSAGNQARLNTTGGDTIVSTAVYDYSGWYIGSIMRSGSTLTAYKNGADVTTGSPTNSAVFSPNSLFGNASFLWYGDVGEFIIFPTALSAGNMTSVWTYLNTLWAVY